MAIRRAALAAVLVLGMACLAAAASPANVFVKENIVATWADCPVKKPADWDPAVFDPSLDAMTELGQKKYASAISRTCQDRLMGLADCVSDNDPFSGATMTSLSTSNGCCLQGCVDAIKAAIADGCFEQLMKTSLCTDPEALKYRTGIINAGVRCADYHAECPVVTATLEAANATTTVTTAVKNATAAAAAPAAAAPAAAAPAPAKVHSGAAGAALSAAAAVVGAAGLLLL